MGDLDADELADLALALSPFGSPSDAASLRRACESDELAQRLISAAKRRPHRPALLGTGVDAATTPRQRLSLLGELLSELQAECLSGVAPTPIRAPAPVPAAPRCARRAVGVAAPPPPPSRKGEAPCPTRCDGSRRRRGRSRVRRRRLRRPPRRRRRAAPPPTRRRAPRCRRRSRRGAARSAGSRTRRSARDTRCGREGAAQAARRARRLILVVRAAPSGAAPDARLRVPRSRGRKDVAIEPRRFGAIAVPTPSARRAAALSWKWPSTSEVKKGGSARGATAAVQPTRPFPPRIASAEHGGDAAASGGGGRGRRAGRDNTGADRGKQKMLTALRRRGGPQPRRIVRERADGRLR